MIDLIFPAIVILEMRIKTKLNYIKKIVSVYRNWYSILFDRLLNKNTQRVIFRDNTIILGGPRSRIVDLTDEIWVKGVYTPTFLPIQRFDTVMDVGANVGVFSVYAATKGATTIYAIEPIKENTKLIRKNFEINKLPQPIIITKAIAAKSGISKFYTGDIDSHGRLIKSSPRVKKKQVIFVNTITISEVLSGNNIKKIDFLKIDCEGGEGEMLKSMEKSDWNKIRKISIEYHDNMSSLNHEQIIKILKDNDFHIKLKRLDDVLGYIYAWRSDGIFR